MKNTYVKPEMQVEEFLANNYCVSVCGKKDGKYIFTCDAPAGNVHVTYKGKDYNLGGYKPCSKIHETDGPSGYYDGWVDYNKNGRKDSNEPDALIWVEGFSYNAYRDKINWTDYHASSSLTRGQIDVERS
ncbi:MAG: hypothetical protein MJZ83_01645 [Bacteroidaceae bacterium]|nr:hypothetical protein [Bacteroidaceae bacterium]